MGMSEAELKAQIRLALGRRADVRLFNNPVGQAWVGQSQSQRDGSILLLRPHRVVYGLFPGSADLFGWRSVVITPEMVGQTIAQVVSPEVKAGRYKPTDEQLRWRDNVLAAGGRAGIVRSVEDALALVGTAP